jgi:hypothetical protein
MKGHRAILTVAGVAVLLAGCSRAAQPTTPQPSNTAALRELCANDIKAAIERVVWDYTNYTANGDGTINTNSDGMIVGLAALQNSLTRLPPSNCSALTSDDINTIYADQLAWVNQNMEQVILSGPAD